MGIETIQIKNTKSPLTYLLKKSIIYIGQKIKETCVNLAICFCYNVC